ncbi:hypothetical protein Lser_V15G22038 [Lactuca serriola]
MDGNNQVLPLAHGICKKESGLTWTWFLEKLYECVGDCQELTFVTDRVDAIRVSIENVFPHAHHGLCAFHLLGNIVHRFGKNDKTKVLFWRLVKAYKRNVFEELWYRFSSTRPQVATYLSEIPHVKWTRAYSLSKRYDYMTSNSAESMNALYVDARKMPIIPLLEFFRRLSQEWCNKHRIEGVLTEWAEKVVRKNEERTIGWSVSGVSDAIYQVHDFKHGGIVDLRQETYAYKMETYRSTYEEPVYPLPKPCDWEIPAEMMVVRTPDNGYTSIIIILSSTSLHSATMRSRCSVRARNESLSLFVVLHPIVVVAKHPMTYMALLNLVMGQEKGRSDHNRNNQLRCTRKYTKLKMNSF